METMIVSTSGAAGDYETIHNSGVGEEEMDIDNRPAADKVADEDDELHDLLFSCCKSLSMSVFREITPHVLSYYSGSPAHVKVAAGAMMINMWYLVVTKGHSRGDIVWS